jgi:formylmethanofuran dehydrogenase subunit D
MGEHLLVTKLQVKESPIEKSGVSRIHISVLKDLGVEVGNTIVVSSDNGSILVHVYADTLIEENKISLRPVDRKKLGVVGEDEVAIAPYKIVKK